MSRRCVYYYHWKLNTQRTFSCFVGTMSVKTFLRSMDSTRNVDESIIFHCGESLLICLMWCLFLLWLKTESSACMVVYHLNCYNLNKSLRYLDHLSYLTKVCYAICCGPIQQQVLRHSLQVCEQEDGVETTVEHLMFSVRKLWQNSPTNTSLILFLEAIK